MEDVGNNDQALLLRELKRQSLAVDEERFLEIHAGYFLFGQIPESSEDDWSFVTDVRAVDSGPGWDSLLRGRASSDTNTEWLLWKVEKSDRNAFKRRISIGRATNNDIIIRHHSISKLHAHFHFGTIVRLRHLGASVDLLLSDVGSVNGSSVDERQLREGKKAPVCSGNKLLFGHVRCELLDATALYRMLRSTLL